jgi:hypothetical protein
MICSLALARSAARPERFKHAPLPLLLRAHRTKT